MNHVLIIFLVVLCVILVLMFGDVCLYMRAVAQDFDYWRENWPGSGYWWWARRYFRR